MVSRFIINLTGLKCDNVLKKISYIRRCRFTLGDDNVCSEQAMVFLYPDQEYGYAANLEQGEDDVSSSLETLPNDVAGCVEVCRGSHGKEYAASEASYSIGPLAKKKKHQQPSRARIPPLLKT